MLLPPTIRRIVLTGFMGAGKSTTGALLAHSLGWRFVDLDQAIEKRSARSVAEIFAQDGEDAFRMMEAEAIREHAAVENLVLALGGGAVEYEGTRAALSELRQTAIVFLDAPLEIMVARCLAERGAAERPVLRDRERLRQRFLTRLPQYRRAHLTVSTEGLSPEAVVSLILSRLPEVEAAGSDVFAASAQGKGLSS